MTEHEEKTHSKDDGTARQAAQDPLRTAGSKSPPPASNSLNWSGPVAAVVIAVVVVLIFALVIL